MRFISLMCCLLILPLAAHAQDVNRAASPMLVVNPAQPAAPAATSAAAPAAVAPLPPSFPDWAVTQVGNKTAPQPDNAITPPSTPSSPVPSTPETPSNAATPAAPNAPPSPVSKLWPRDTIQIFLPSCTGFHPEMVQPCTCIITRLMAAMGHDEFLFKSEAGTIEQDPRLITIRNECGSAPRQRQ